MRQNVKDLRFAKRALCFLLQHCPKKFCCRRKMLCCIEQKAASRREKIPPGTKFLVKHDTILQQKEELRIDTARRVWDNGGNKQNAKGVVTMPPELRWLSDPTVFVVNRLDAHSDHVCYRSAAEAAAGRPLGGDVEDAYHVSGEGNHSVAFRVLL